MESARTIEPAAAPDDSAPVAVVPAQVAILERHATIGSAPVIKSWSRRVVADLVGFGDIALILAALVVPYLINTIFAEPPSSALNLLRASLLAGLIAYGCFAHFKLYAVEDMTDFPIDSGRITASIAIAMLVVLGVAMPERATQSYAYLLFSVTWALVAAALVIAYRRIVRHLLARFAAAGHFDERIAVYGAGPAAVRVCKHLGELQSGVQLVGLFDDRGDEARIGQPTGEVCGSLEDLIQAGREGLIDRIIVTLPQAADRRVVEIAAKLERLPVKVQAVTHFSNDLIDRQASHKVSNLGPVGLINVKDRPLADWSPIVKRGEDIILSSLFLLLSLPFVAIIAAVIKLTSRGPVFFRQRRRGLNHRVIEVLKFRTMTVQEDDNNVRQATGDDVRVTTIGWFLRRSSLDELPQLLNVLQGEMSLVGPRPHALIHDAQWGEMLETYANRHQVKPGITGLAQVRGLRGEAREPKDIEERIDADLEYINSWSLWLDLTILTRTVAAVIGAKNAY